VKGNDLARIELLKQLCEQAKRLRDDAEALCGELTQQIERAHRTRPTPRIPALDRRRVMHAPIVERRRRR
jgi:hypothetical protein